MIFKWLMMIMIMMLVVNIVRYFVDQWNEYCQDDSPDENNYYQNE